MRKYLRLGFIVPALLIWYMIANPAGAAALTNRALGALEHAGNSAMTYVNSVGQ